jgi:hypothetical protein
MADVDSTPVDNSFAASEHGDDTGAHNTVSATVGTRRQANGTIGSVYSGNRIKHLKKDDGIPLWRKDIQYQFLKLVFEDKTLVFTRYSDGAKNLDFADVYIDCMARSSKTSKILKDKLQSDKRAAISMAMVCLLVNVGRMNTTLNCTWIKHLSFFIQLKQKKEIYELLLTTVLFDSLPRNASATENVPFNSIPPSKPGSECIQAATRCSTPEVDLERRLGRQ